jgi:HEAT repeat protein
VTLFLLALNAAAAAFIVVLSATAARRRVADASMAVSRRERPIQELLSDLQSDDEAKVAAAAHAVFRQPAKYQAALVALIERLRRAQPHARVVLLAAIRAVLRTRSALGRFCWPDPDADLRAAIVTTLTTAPDEPGEPAASLTAADIIEAATTDSSSAVRCAALANFKLLPTERALPIIWRALGDRDPDVEQRACAALVGRLEPDAIPRVVDYLSRVPRARARWMLQALSRTDASIVDPLVQMASEGDHLRRQVTALRALGAAALPATCVDLVRLLHDANPAVRRAAAMTIAEIARLVAGRGLDPSVARSMSLQLSRETDVAVTLALLDGLEACGDADGGRAIAERLPALPAALRERGLEAIAALQHQPTGPPTVRMTQV